MKRIFLLFGTIAIVGTLGVVAYSSFATTNTPNDVAPTMVEGVKAALVEPVILVENSTEQESESVEVFVNPIENALKRMTKKQFGTKISPDHSPIPNEHFNGYHSAVDFEVLDESENTSEVPIRTVCEGPLRMKQWAKGYGGVAVQECTLNGNPISIIYGHMDIASISTKVGQEMIPGQYLGNLGDANSHETDGARKHLHLGFYNGVPADIRGYVPTLDDLSKYIDPCLHICE